MSDIPTLYQKLFEGRTVTIRLPDKKGYDSLRTALVRYNSMMVGIDLSTHSLCADWDSASCTGKFWLGKPRRQKVSWEIVDESAPTVRSFVEPDSESGGSPIDTLSTFHGADDHPSSAQGEESAQHNEETTGYASIWEALQRAGEAP